jgi:RNA polymerase sigma-70 factor (ECF subfamily)
MVEDPAAAVVPDDELVRRIAGRDAEALAAVFRRHYAVVYRFALHLTGAAALAEDVTQEVFLAMMRDAGRYEPGRSTVAAWLCGIARNLTRQRLAQDRRIVPLPDGEETEEQRFDGGSHPLDALIHADRLEDLRRAVLSLPLAYREVVVLCDLQEFSYADTAAALGCAIGTVRSRLHRARGLLARKLREAPADGGRLRYVV